MHDYSGIHRARSARLDRWAKELVAPGYEVILPDSFGSQGFGDGICTVNSSRQSDVNPVRRMCDSCAALAYLQSVPFVDAVRSRRSARVGRTQPLHSAASGGLLRAGVCLAARARCVEAVGRRRYARLRLGGAGAIGLGLTPACVTSRSGTGVAIDRAKDHHTG